MNQMTEDQVKMLFQKIRKDDTDSEGELIGGAGNLKFDAILDDMGIQDIMSGSESEEESKKGAPKLMFTTKVVDMIKNA